MRNSYSLRFKLITLFLASIFIPIFIITCIIPSYYNLQLSKETAGLINNTLISMSENVSTYLDELDKLTISPYFNDDIIGALKLKENNEYDTCDSYTRLIADRALNSAIPNYLSYTRKDILSTIIINKGKCIFYSTRNKNAHIIKDYDFSEKTWYKEAVAANGKAVFIGSHKQDYFSNAYLSEVFSIARLIKDPNTQEPLAVIMADANTAIFRKMFWSLKFNVPSTILLLDQKKNVLYSTHSVPPKLIAQVEKNQQIINTEDNAYMVVSKIIEPCNWEIAVLLSYSKMKSKTKWMYMASIFFAFLGLSITFFIFHNLSKNLVKPIEEMITIMNEVKKGNLNVRFSQQSYIEINSLGNVLNSMISRLKELIDKEYRLVIKQKHAEYKALQSQIQPHFLYNTLNGFIGLNRLGERQLLEKSIFDLTGMLRYTLSQQDKTTLGEEFGFLKKYCDLQKIRFEDRMNVDIYYDPLISHCKIPKLLLQPLVENAIIHGIEPLDRECHIVITANSICENNIHYIVISIDDDGAGYDVSKQMDKNHIGILNVKERLNLNYMNSIFIIDSKPYFGTHVVIKIPKEEMEE